MANYLSYFLTPTLAVNLPILVAASLALTLLVRGRLATRPRRVLFFLTALSLGVIVHVTLLREPPGGRCLECLNYWSTDRLLSGQLGTEVPLNIALFVPLGLLATLLWRRPWRFAAFAAVLSYAIEIAQPLIGVGSNDMRDITANTFGAFVGAGLGVAVLIVKDSLALRPCLSGWRCPFWPRWRSPQPPCSDSRPASHPHVRLMEPKTWSRSSLEPRSVVSRRTRKRGRRSWKRSGARTACRWPRLAVTRRQRSIASPGRSGCRRAA